MLRIVVLGAILAGFGAGALGLDTDPDSLSFLALIVVVVLGGLFAAERLEHHPRRRNPGS